MEEEKEQTGASWDEKSEGQRGDRAVTDEEAGGDASTTTTGESIKEQAEKCSPNLLEMLKAAESRRTHLGRDRDTAETSEPGEPVAEAQKTDMVSEHTD